MPHCIHNVSPGAKVLTETTVFLTFLLQRNFSMSVNSSAVLRLTGRGGGPIVGAPRGRSTSRGRGELMLGCCMDKLHYAIRYFAIDPTLEDAELEQHHL